MAAGAEPQPRWRIGIGGWKYAPWRGSFYPDDLPQRLELAYASEHLTAIEINSTYYGTQKPASFRSWHAQTPADFKFSLKAPRAATQRHALAEAGDSIQRFVDSGISELGDKLGPLVWQFPPTKVFDPLDFEAFLALLPPSIDKRTLNHVLDLRHPSFCDPECLALARAHGVTTVFTDSREFPSFADRTCNALVYARLMEADAHLPHGYSDAAIDGWSDAVQAWLAGRTPKDLPLLEDRPPAPEQPGGGVPQEVYLFFINGAKEKAPAAAQALLRKLASTPH